MKKVDRLLHKLPQWLGSKWFGRTVLGCFVLEGLWVAISAVYPQAFDEDFHLGIIGTYSHHWLPFLGNQPSGADAFGAVSRDPSYLYHYLLSFPYRLLTPVFHLVSEQVIALRIINVGLFTIGLILFRRVLARLGLSKTAVNLATFVMVLIPVAPQLAGQINYDNLLLPLTAWACLLTFDVIDALNQKRLSLQPVIKLLTICFVATLVKYEFAPLFLAIGLFLLIHAWRRLGWLSGFGASFRAALKEWGTVSAISRVAWMTLLIVSLGLFVQRDGLNLVRYHTLVPKCQQVISIEQCSQYSVWIHDYLSHQAVQAHQVIVHTNPFVYFWQWLYWLWYRLFFVINGPYHHFQNFPPLPLPAACFGLLGLTTLVAVAINGRRLFRSSPYAAFLGLMVLIYSLTLLVMGFLKYLDTGVLELMNGRYLFPILLPAMALGWLAIRPWLSRKPQLKPLLALIVLVCFLQGGGVLSFILRSDNTWDWNNSAVVHLNNAARDVLSPVIIEGPKTYGTRVWVFN